RGLSSCSCVVAHPERVLVCVRWTIAGTASRLLSCSSLRPAGWPALSPLSLHDALPICLPNQEQRGADELGDCDQGQAAAGEAKEIGRAHVLTPVTVASRMPSSA